MENPSYPNRSKAELEERRRRFVWEAEDVQIYDANGNLTWDGPKEAAREAASPPTPEPL